MRRRLSRRRGMELREGGMSKLQNRPLECQRKGISIVVPH